MILYRTYSHFWWMRTGGSTFVKSSCLLPALMCVAMTWLLQNSDVERCSGLNREVKRYDADGTVFAQKVNETGGIEGCSEDDIGFLLKWQHPYAHQVFSLSVTFLLTYRSQLAYQRFWEARTHMTMMSNRWGDASTSLFIFDDQCSAEAAQTQKSYRGKLLHLMSLLHCFACLHLMRREEEEEEEQEDKEEEEDDDKRLQRPAQRQLDKQLDFRCFRFAQLQGWFARTIRRCLAREDQRKNKQGRFRLGVLGELTDGEKRALFPPWKDPISGRKVAVASEKIEALLYRNHELPRFACFDSASDREVLEEKRTLVEANMFDRVSLIIGWVMRLVGKRRDEGGVDCPPPVLSRPYQNLSDGHLAFGMCKKIRDTPFPYPYAQLMRILLYMFALSFPFVATWAATESDNGVWPARVLAFMCCMAMFALNEVARELEVPFHVAHNDINIEELHDEFLSMLETLHTNFDGTAVGPDEADFHNDLKNKVITPEHTIDSYCRCAACVAADEARRGDEAKEVKKDGMIWNTTENATKQQDKDFAKLISQTSFWKDREPTEAEDGRFWRKEFHKLQALRIAKLKRDHIADSTQDELICLELAAKARQRIPADWTDRSKNAWIDDIDLWLLLEAKHQLLAGWLSPGPEALGVPTPTASKAPKLRRRNRPKSVYSNEPEVSFGQPSVRDMAVDSGWALTIAGWERHLDKQLAENRLDKKSKIGPGLGSEQGLGLEHRDEQLELMYLWQWILRPAESAAPLGLPSLRSVAAPALKLSEEEQGWLDHASVFMASAEMELLDDGLAHCKKISELYRHLEDPRQHFEETVIRMLSNIAKRRALSIEEEIKLEDLQRSVLHNRRKDFHRLVELREKQAHEALKEREELQLKRLEVDEVKDLTAEEEKELDALRLKKYGRAMTGVGLRELQTKEAKDANGGEDQDEYLKLLEALDEASLEEEQRKQLGWLRLLSLSRRKEKGLLEPGSDDLRRYEDLQRAELERRRGLDNDLSAEEEQELSQITMAVLRRRSADELTPEERVVLQKLLKERRSDETKDVMLLELLDMRILEDRKAAEPSLFERHEDDKTDRELQIQLEKAKIKVLDRRSEGAKDWSEEEAEELKALKAKEAERKKRVDRMKMRDIQERAARILKETPDDKPSEPASDREIRKTIDQLEDEDLKGMRSDKEEELLDRLHALRLQRELKEIELKLSKQLSHSDDDSDEEAQKAREEELEHDAERTRFDLERRQRTILEREKAEVTKLVKEAEKALSEEQKRTDVGEGERSPQNASVGPDDSLTQPTDESQGDAQSFAVDTEAAKALAQRKDELSAIDAQLDKLALQDLERRQEKGLLDSDEEHELDLQIKKCLKRQQELSEQESEKLRDAELRLLEFKQASHALDDVEQRELEHLRFASLVAKKEADEGFTASDEQKLEKVIVDIYTRRKKAAELGAQEKDREPTWQEWSSDADLDLKRYELKQLQRQQEGGSLDLAQTGRVYQLRCEMIDQLTERVEVRRDEANSSQVSEPDLLEPEPEPEPATEVRLSLGALGIPEPEPEPEHDSLLDESQDVLGSDGVFELRRAHRLPSTRLSMLPLAQLSPLQSPAQLNATGFGSMMVSPTARGAGGGAEASYTLLSNRLTPADEEQELEALKTSLKEDLIRIHESKDAQHTLTLEQQGRLRDLGGPELGPEILTKTTTSSVDQAAARLVRSSSAAVSASSPTIPRTVSGSVPDLGSLTAELSSVTRLSADAFEGGGATTEMSSESASASADAVVISVEGDGEEALLPTEGEEETDSLVET